VVAAIEEILDSKVITLGKPNEIALQTVADRLSVDVGAILMVGDSLRADIAAAANAGAVSCHFDDPGISSSYRALNDGPTPNHVVRDLGEVRTLLDRLT
jgi:ribonucleotide monophosphatase NagD (HAD superfamily)